MTETNLNPCDEPGYTKDIRIDAIQPNCGKEPSLKNVPDRELSWLLDELANKKDGHGQSALCDPIQTGHIINEQGGSAPNRNTLYRYSKSLRGCDEAVTDLFRDIVVLAEDGKAHNLPIIWATQEKAVAAIMQENVRKDTSLVVERIKLPLLAIHSTSYLMNQKRYRYHKAVDYIRTYNESKPGFVSKEKYERDTVFGVASGIPVDVSYTLYVWTLYEHDAKQIIEQILSKFSPMAYIRVRGIAWEIGVQLAGPVTSTGDSEPGDKAVAVKKYKVDLLAESFISQPIIRKKSVLKTQIDVVDSIENNVIGDIITRLEKAVEELKE